MVFLRFLPILLLLDGLPTLASGLKPKTAEAYEQYVRQREEAIRCNRIEGRRFLWLEESIERLRKARAGEIVIDDWNDGPSRNIPDGMIQDWIGGVYIPGATLSQTLALVQDYDNHERYYAPEVINSRLIERNGDRFRIHLRLLKKKVITAVLDTEHDVRYFTVNEHRAHSRSASTRIVEIDDFGESSQRELPPGRDHGFMWRWNSYWRFEQRDGGVYAECESISLSRDIPFGLGFLIEPLIRSLPRESLHTTLENTRRAVMALAAR